MGAHSKRSASAFERWEACAASVKHCEGKKSIESEPAKEGTFAHDQAERFVRGELPADQFNKLPEEMQDAINIYSHTLFNDQFTKFPDRDNPCVLLLEHKFDLSSVYPECFGTADAVMWDPRSQILRIYDFKYGKGYFVEVEDNAQMQYYGLGAVVTLPYPAKVIELVVVQPRCTRKPGHRAQIDPLGDRSIEAVKGKEVGAVRRWRLTPLEMMEFEHRFIEACKRTDDPNAEFVPGRYCYWCPGHFDCPAKVAERLEKAKNSFEVIPDDDEEGIDPFS